MKLPGIPVYLQVKRATRMIRSNAREALMFPGLPFFRMYLHRRDHSGQQQLLLDLESVGNVVVYAAPGFSEAHELNDAYSHDLVAMRSIFIRPSAIGPLTDNAQHWVAFQTMPTIAFRCSRPLSVDYAMPQELFRPQAAAELPRRSGQPAPKSYGSVAEELLSIYERRHALDRDRVADIRNVRMRRAAPDFAQLVARTLFQCELLILPK